MTDELELELYYQNRFAMFAEQGWKDLIVDLQNMRAALDTLSGASVDNLLFRQGELSLIDWLLQLESISKKGYADIRVSMPEGAHDGITDEAFNKAARH